MILRWINDVKLLPANLPAGDDGTEGT